MTRSNGHSDNGNAGAIQEPAEDEALNDVLLPAAPVMPRPEVATRAKQRAKQQIQQNRFVIIGAGAIVIALLIFVATSMPHRGAPQKVKSRGTTAPEDLALESGTASNDKSLFPITDSGRPELPDATFPGILRELVGLDFPLIVNAQITIPDQAKVIKGYKSRLRKMQAVQRDSNGGFRTNVEAQVAESQLVRVQQDIISSSVKTAKLSLVIGTRTSHPAITTKELEQSERTIDNQRQQLLYAISRMNGAKAVAESLAKKRLFFSSLPAMAEPDKRDQDLLTSNAADLVPVETPWRGTPRSPLFLLETPYRQLIPFSPFDPGLSDANMLVMAKTGGGKTVMVQQFLLMAARSNPLISILERGDSYRPLVELMGGQMITMSLDSDQTINPWDLPEGERAEQRPSRVYEKSDPAHARRGRGRRHATS